MIPPHICSMCIKTNQVGKQEVGIWPEHAQIIPISRMVDFCESCSPFHVCLTICPSPHLVYAVIALSMFFIPPLPGGGGGYTVLPLSVCGRTYGQTNMKRAITLAKINHPWNRYNMCMLRSWLTKIPNMNKIQQKTND
jgi:hypothetical protein